MCVLVICLGCVEVEGAELVSERCQLGRSHVKAGQIRTTHPTPELRFNAWIYFLKI